MPYTTPSVMLSKRRSRTVHSKKMPLVISSVSGAMNTAFCMSDVPSISLIDTLKTMAKKMAPSAPQAKFNNSSPMGSRS